MTPTATPRIRPLSEMPDAEYDLYVAPALAAVQKLQGEIDALKRDRARILGAICQKYGDDGRISIPYNLLLEDTGTLFRDEAPWNDELTFVWRTAPPPPTGQGSV